MPRQPIEDLSVYLEKEATTTQARFADWIVEETGLTYPTAKEMNAFREGVRLAKALVMRYQASDANKEATAAEKAEKATARATAAAEKPTKAPKPTAAAPAEEAPAKPVKAARGRRGAAATKGADAPF